MIVGNNRVQTTLVAYYGPKPEPFQQLIHLCQKRISELLNHGFIPYQSEQVHATIVGLEGCRIDDKILNKNFIDYRGECRLVDLSQLLQFLKHVPHIELRIGGYKAEHHFGFESRGKHPYERSFAIRGEIAVAMGWPVNGSKPLDCLRRRFTEVNVLHKEHRTDADVDDDFYFVLGRVDKRVAKDEAIEVVNEELRKFFANCEPVELVLSRESLSIVAYLDPQLPLSTSCAFDLIKSGLDGPTLVSVYPQC